MNNNKSDVVLPNKPNIDQVTFWSNNNEDSNEDTFSLIWNNLSHYYEEKVSKSPLIQWKKEKVKKQILNPMTGQLNCGSLNAILGPSGSGKTTLLNCITGRAKGKIQGECFIRRKKSPPIKTNCVRIGYVPQVDSFFTRFTIRETIYFTSKIHNQTYTSNQHLNHIESIIESLDLTDVIDWPLNKLSNGQMKRTSITVELISKPLILVLDEPTSGLDSYNTENLIITLKKLSLIESNIRPIILLTIHSPSYEVFSQFDQIYLLSKNGFNIYQGHPILAIDFFVSFGFHQLKGNPAEAMIDVANGKFGFDKLNKMAVKSMKNVTFDSNSIDEPISMINSSSSSDSMFTLILLLIKRSLFYNFVRVPQAIFRIVDHMIPFFLLTFSLNFTLALDAICLETADENISYSTKLKLGSKHKLTTLITLCSYIGILLINATFVPSIGATILMTTHLPVHKRELANSWYSLGSYFTFKVIADAIIRIIVLVPPSLAFFYRSQAPFESERILLFVFSILISATI